MDFEKGRQRYNNDECQLGTLDGQNRACTTTSTDANGYADALKFERTQYALTHTGRFALGTLDSAATYNMTETIGRTIPGTIGASYAGYPSIVGGDSRTLESKDLILDTKFVAPIGENNITTLALNTHTLNLQMALPSMSLSKSQPLFLLKTNGISSMI